MAATLNHLESEGCGYRFDPLQRISQTVSQKLAQMKHLNFSPEGRGLAHQLLLCEEVARLDWQKRAGALARG